MTLTKNKIRLMELCFNNNLPINFEYSKGSYDNINIKNITPFNDFSSYGEEDKNMLLDMQNNIFTDKDMIEYFSTKFKDYTLHKKLPNLGGEKVMLIFINETKKGVY